MKKKFMGCAFLYWGKHRRTFWIMKNLVLFILFFSLQAHSSTFSQSRMSVQLENSSIKELFKMIEDQTSLDFLYDDGCGERCLHFSYCTG